MSNVPVHVVPHDEGWAVKTENSERAYRVTELKEEAVRIGREVAMNQQAELIVHDASGKIASRDSYGHDPQSSQG